MKTTLEEQLKDLRRKWVEEPGRRPILRVQAKLIQMAIDKRDGKIRR